MFTSSTTRLVFLDEYYRRLSLIAPLLRSQTSVSTEDVIPEGAALGEVRQRPNMVHRMMRNFKVYTSHLKDNAIWVVVRRPLCGRVTEKLDSVTPGY